MAIEDAETQSLPSYVKKLDHNHPANELPRITEMPKNLAEVEALMAKARKAGQYDVLHPLAGALGNIATKGDPKAFEELREMKKKLGVGPEQFIVIDDMEREVKEEVAQNYDALSGALNNAINLLNDPKNGPLKLTEDPRVPAQIIVSVPQLDEKHENDDTL